MNKSKVLLLAMMILLSVTLLLVSCDIPTPDIDTGGGKEPHTHAFGEKWVTDEYDHWHECSCGKTADLAQHGDADGNGICDTCGFVIEQIPEPEPTLYTVKYYIKLSNGDYKKLFEQKVDSKTGFTAEQLAAKNSIMHDEGYLIDYIYADKEESALFDFSVPPTDNVSVYCGRDITKAGVNVKWSCEQNKKGGYTLSFTGTGDMYEFYYESTVPWHEYKDLINEVVIPEGITSIADCAFYQFSLIDTVKLPKTLRHIGKNAFYQSSISRIVFPDSLRTIGEAAFQDCLGLVHCTFNDGLENIGKAAYYQCKNLETMVFPKSLGEIGGSAFYSCTSISSVYYLGSESEYNEIKAYLDNFWAQELAVTYFISETEPEAPGPYWYHGESGEICQWYHTVWYMASASEKTPFVRDYVSVADGYSQANVDFFNSIVYHGYKFDHFRLSGKSTAYVMTVSDKLTKDIRLIGIRGRLCGDNLKWDYRNNTLTIDRIDESDPDGAMWDFETVKDSPWYGNRTNIRKVILDGVTYIGSYAFADIKTSVASQIYDDFSYIDIPLSVTKINIRAFSGCDNLLYIYYEGTDLSNVEGIDSLLTLQNAHVYSSAVSLDTSTLKAGAYWTYVLWNSKSYRIAWMYDGDTKTLTVGGGDYNTPTAIGIKDHYLPDFASLSNAPWANYALEVESIVISENIVRVGQNNFNGMSAVTAIQASKRLRIIKGNSFTGTAFYNTKLQNEGAVYIPTADGSFHLVKVNSEVTGTLYIIREKTLTVAEAAFEGCSSVKDLVFSKDIAVNAIHSSAFAGLTAIEKIFYWGEEESWVEYGNYSSESLIGLEGAQVYFYTASNPYPAAAEGDALFWHWNDPALKDTPVIWEAPSDES